MVSFLWLVTKMEPDDMPFLQLLRYPIFLIPQLSVKNLFLAGERTMKAGLRHITTGSLSVF